MKRRKFVNQIGKGLAAISFWVALPTTGKVSSLKLANMSVLASSDFDGLIGSTVRLVGASGQKYEAILKEIEVVDNGSDDFRNPFVLVWNNFGKPLPEDGLYAFELPTKGLVQAYFMIKSNASSTEQLIENVWN